ncbi:hypothetical protein C1645_823483 [Glomus cerebriforme]|uniref:Transmembrane protein n=1 Tax=Glomus cerebriforme TaxID=658196 RepID=A0A397SWC3_9GLOM|nr:hypothetical protein C1645_823483 [Glomus cerebriforme]
MNLVNLLQGHRRSESTFLLGLKLLIMIIILSGLTGYLAILIIEVKQDAPITITSFINVEGIRPPNLYFRCAYNISIDLCSENYLLNNIFTPVMCSPEDTSVVFDEQSNNYIGTYKPSQDVFFRKKSLNSLYSVLLFININEEITIERPSAMTLMAYDSEYDLMDKYNLSTYDDSILLSNSYTITPNQGYLFSYSRTIKELITPSWMNDFGIPPTYEQKPSISSNLVGNPLSQLKLAEKHVEFTIQPKYINTVQVDREVRTHTYLGSLGLIGGAWGLGAAIYAFLFGADTLRPWGAVHLYCCGFSRAAQNKLKNALPIIPFFDTSDPKTKEHPKKGLSLAEQNELLSWALSRIDVLELFLQEYVIDVQFLDKIRKLKQNYDNDNNETGDEQEKNLASITTVTTEPSQQEESIMITIPPNLTQNSTTDNSSTTTTTTTYTADTADISQDDSSRHQNNLTQQQ